MRKPADSVGRNVEGGGRGGIGWRQRRSRPFGTGHDDGGRGRSRGRGQVTER
jgi:hypothetical protein